MCRFRFLLNGAGANLRNSSIGNIVMNLILLGYPGAGKGTQANLLTEKYGFHHISTGDLIRNEIAAKTPLGLEVEAEIQKGNLVSDSMILDILINTIKDLKGDIIFDGFPRTISQAEALDKYLALHNMKIDAVILLKLSEEEVLKRLTSRRICKKCGAIYNIHSPDYTGRCTKCGGELYTREDDTLQSAKHRLEVFHKETQPLLDYYKARPCFKEVDGSCSVEEVFASISRALGLIK